MDLITQLPQTADGHTAIVMFVDRLSKMAILAPTKTTLGAKEFAQLFMERVFSRIGIPESILSERDTRFTSAFFKEFCQWLGIKQNMSTAFHPQTDGQTERMNRVLEEMLRSFGNTALRTWDVHLPECEYAINNAFNESVRYTPFFLNYVRHTWTPSSIAIQRHAGTSNGTSYHDSFAYFRNLSCARQEAQAALRCAQQRLNRDKLSMPIKDGGSKNLRKETFYSLIAGISDSRLMAQGSCCHGSSVRSQLRSGLARLLIIRNTLF